MKRLAHIYRLGLKELTSLRHDSVLLVFLLYAFSVAIYMPAKGSIMGVHNASVAIVDEDRSPLSRRLAEVLQPPEFQPTFKPTYGLLLDAEELETARGKFAHSPAAGALHDAAAEAAAAAH